MTGLYDIRYGKGTVHPEDIPELWSACFRVPVDIPPDFDWSFANNRGRLSTRIVQFAYERGLTPQLDAGGLGTMISELQPLTAKMKIQTLNGRWQPGAWGDPHSCFWADSHSWAIMRRHRALSIHILSETGAKARCFAIPYKDGLLIFNAYKFTLIRFARILANLLGYNYKKTCIKTAVYINNAPYFVGPREVTIEDPVTFHDGDWGTVCEQCLEKSYDYIMTGRWRYLCAPCSAKFGDAPYEVIDMENP